MWIKNPKKHKVKDTIYYIMKMLCEKLEVILDSPRHSIR